MTIHQYSGPLNFIAIQQALKPDEKIVCTNATVAVDQSGNVTAWFNNDVPVCLLSEKSSCFYDEIVEDGDF